MDGPDKPDLSATQRSEIYVHLGGHDPGTTRFTRDRDKGYVKRM
jgi:hypothetical protein